jgi:hypothetical protein
LKDDWTAANPQLFCDGPEKIVDLLRNDLGTPIQRRERARFGLMHAVAAGGCGTGKAGSKT